MPVVPMKVLLLFRSIPEPVRHFRVSNTHAAEIKAFVLAIAGIIFLTTPIVSL